MDAATPRLLLEEFIVEMGREPVGSLTHERFMDLVRRLRLSDELIESRTCFTEEHYARNLVCRTPTFELLVLCWRPGHESTIHDHMGSLNAISVFDGELTSRLFRPVGEQPLDAGPVEQTADDCVQSDQGWIGVDRGGIHQLADTGPDDLVTVHVYAPALMELNVYSVTSPKVVRRPLRYTLTEDLD